MKPLGCRVGTKGTGAAQRFCASPNGKPDPQALSHCNREGSRRG